MKITPALLVLCCGWCFGATYEGVDYDLPSGWKVDGTQGSLSLTPINTTPENAAAIVLGPAESLSGESFSAWVDQKLQDELSDGTKILQSSEPTRRADGEIQKITLGRVMEDPGGVSTLRVYQAVTDGKLASIALAITISEDAASIHAKAFQTFFNSMRIHGSGVLPEPSASGNFNLTGDWTTTNYFGDIVDSTTGAFASTAYSGQWYSFRADGTYRHTMIAGGQILSGAAISEGTYRIEGGRLLRLSQKTVSWIPMPGSTSAQRRPRYDKRPEPREMQYEIAAQNGKLLIKDSIGSWTTYSKK